MRAEKFRIALTQVGALDRARRKSPPPPSHRNATGGGCSPIPSIAGRFRRKTGSGATRSGQTPRTGGEADENDESRGARGTLRQGPKQRSHQGNTGRGVAGVTSPVAAAVRSGFRGAAGRVLKRSARTSPKHSGRLGAHIQRPSGRRALALEFSAMARPAPAGKPAPSVIRATVPRKPEERDAPRRPSRNHRSGPMSKGELYEHYRRIGCLEQFFGMFPQP